MASIFCACSIVVRHANAPSFGRVERFYVGTRCRAPYGSGASVCGGVVEKPPHNTLVCARVRMRDAHKWGVERVVGTRIIRAARGGRPGGQTSRPTAMTHRGHGWCAQECRIGCRTMGEARVCRMVFTKVPFCTTREDAHFAISLAKIVMLSTAWGGGRRTLGAAPSAWKPICSVHKRRHTREDDFYCRERRLTRAFRARRK